MYIKPVNISRVSIFGNCEKAPVYLPKQRSKRSCSGSRHIQPRGTNQRMKTLTSNSLGALLEFKNKYLQRHMIFPVFLKLTSRDTNHMLFELETLPLPPMENNMNNRPFSKVRPTRMAHHFKSRVKILTGTNCAG